MADETVTSGFRLFCPAVSENVWDERRGASLRTFFVNSCVREFPNTYRWIRTREERVAEPMDIEDMHRIVGVALNRMRSRESEYAEYDELKQALRGTSPQFRAVIAYVAQGYTAREAAERLGTTLRAVESSLRRLRIRVALASADDVR
jgi:DNA-directed RNA polymerase specialized sigma24 family protein